MTVLWQVIHTHRQDVIQLDQKVSPGKTRTEVDKASVLIACEQLVQLPLSPMQEGSHHKSENICLSPKFGGRLVK